MSPLEFSLLANLVKQRLGIVLGPDKQYLAESRLASLARQESLPGVGDLMTRLRSGDERLVRAICDAMTTNETSFFRDGKPFEAFRQFVLPRLVKQRADSKRLRILSCAASTGQEAYSIAMCLNDEVVTLRGWQWDIVATDINQTVLDKARAGIYSDYDVQRGLPERLRARYFSKTRDGWQIDRRLREQVTFERRNLLEPITPLGRFDVVLCRNVLIYFAQPTKMQVLDNIAEVIRPDGFLFLGSSETAVGTSGRFVPSAHQPGVYECTPRPMGPAAQQPPRMPGRVLTAG